MEQVHFPTLTPYIVVANATEAIAWYEKALGAVARNVMHTPDHRVMNAQLVIGDSILMLNDEFPDYGSFAPKPGDKLTFTIHMTVKADIDAMFQQAIEAGATVTMPLADMFWGDRYGSFTDPFGYSWSMGQKTRDMTPEQMQAEMMQAFGGPEA